MIIETIETWLDTLQPWLLTHGARIVVVIILAFIINKVASRLIGRAVRISLVRDANLSKVAQKKRQDTLLRIFTGVSGIAIFTMSSLMILQEIGVEIGPLLAGAGIIGLAVGFGGQYLIRDVISGLFIILENQYRIGDVVSFDGTGGLVEDISLRMTTIRDLDGTVHHIPHGEIKKVANLSKFFSRVNLNIGVSYNCQLHRQRTRIRSGLERTHHKGSPVPSG
jgi:small-conductance mechanosensitive channel